MVKDRARIAAPASARLGMCVHERFEEQARRTPRAIAVICRGQRLTYAQLNERANRLGHYLRHIGIGPDVFVAIHLDRSLEMVVALLGILKAGGAYVPLDASYPEQRLAFMLQDTAAPVLLTQKALAPNLPATSSRLIMLDDDWHQIEQYPNSNLPKLTTPDNLAYVMYTSGSTGKPKGVEIPHRGIIRLLFGVDYARMGSDRVFLQLAPLSFDASTFELWAPLLHGGRCVLFPERVPTVHALEQVLHEHHVTTLWLTAGLYNAVIDEAPQILSTIEELLIGGEALSVPHVQRGLELLPHTQIINGYGPTESTTFACCYRIPRNAASNASSIPIGHPIGNTQTYILNDQLKPVPTGHSGELYIGGDGLARGYLNAPELTARRFVSGASGVGRLYRTGDLARYRADGEIEYLGRMDSQVKIRGFRIELAEIEFALTANANIRQAAVICREDVAGDKRLVAYIVPALRGTPVATDKLRSELKKTLPECMVPSTFVTLNTLPLTPNGKVDRKALPKPDKTPLASASKITPPRNELESMLIQMWQNLLDTETFGVEDDFFELGGDSLLAVRLLADIHRRIGLIVPLDALSHARTIRELAVVINGENWKPLPSHAIAIQSHGSCPPLFCVPGVGGHAFMFHGLSRSLGIDYPLYGLQLTDLAATPTSDRSIEDIASRCVREVKAVQPCGPYHFLGYSLGGSIVFEMAQQLRASGDEVAFLGLLDSDGVDYPKKGSLAFRTLLHLKHALTMSPGECLPYLKMRMRNLKSIAMKTPPEGTASSVVSSASPVAKELERTAHSLYCAWLAYVPRFYPGPVTIFRAEEQVNRLGMDYSDMQMGWGGLAPSIDVHVVPGGHLQVFKAPYVAKLANHLRDYLKMAPLEEKEKAYAAVA